MGTGNALLIHGGGLVDPSKGVIGRIAQGLYDSKVYDQLFIGKYSFLSLMEGDYWIYSDEFREQIRSKRGCFFGTCRDIFLTDPILQRKAIWSLERDNISTVIVCGGDGSARQVAEINETFKRNGINFIFAVPLTVDGINGGYSIGLEQAARECVRQIENIVATSLETKDSGNYSVVAVELQGRNRDDIMATTLQTFHRAGKVADCSLEDILLIAVPANYETCKEKLLKTINASKKRTLLLVSEGASIKIPEIAKKTQRKVRTVTIGHQVQSNGQTTLEDMQYYEPWLEDVVGIIKNAPTDSYSIVNDGISRWRESVNYYAKLNPREQQKAQISKGLQLLIKQYMV